MSTRQKTAIIGTVAKFVAKRIAKPAGKFGINRVKGVSNKGYNVGRWAMRKPLSRVGGPVFTGLAYKGYKAEGSAGGLARARRTFPKQGSENSVDMNTHDNRQALLYAAKNRKKFASHITEEYIESVTNKDKTAATNLYDDINSADSSVKTAAISDLLSRLFLKKKKLPYSVFVGDDNIQRATIGKKLEDLYGDNKKTYEKYIRDAEAANDYRMADKYRKMEQRDNVIATRRLYNDAKITLPHGVSDVDDVNYTALAAAVGAPLAGAGTYAALKNKEERRQVNNAYHDMMDAVPELRDANPIDVARHHQYINRYSPTVAKNPYAAGTMIKRIIHSDGALMDTAAIQGLSDIEETRAKTRDARRKYVSPLQLKVQTL